MTLYPIANFNYNTNVKNNNTSKYNNRVSFQRLPKAIPINPVHKENIFKRILLAIGILGGGTTAVALANNRPSKETTTDLTSNTSNKKATTQKEKTPEEYSQKLNRVIELLKEIEDDPEKITKATKLSRDILCPPKDEIETYRDLDEIFSTID